MSMIFEGTTNGTTNLCKSTQSNELFDIVVVADNGTKSITSDVFYMIFFFVFFGHKYPDKKSAEEI